MYLLDTNIISSRAPTKKVAREELADWMDQANDYLFLSMITVAEIESGISQLFRQGASRKAGQIVEWWSAVEALYADRFLPFDVDTSRMTGKLLDRAIGNGHSPDFADAAIAATAFLHGYTVLTDNERHFEPFGVPHLNPFDGLPALPGPATPSP